MRVVPVSLFRICIFGLYAIGGCALKWQPTTDGGTADAAQDGNSGDVVRQDTNESALAPEDDASAPDAAGSDQVDCSDETCGACSPPEGCDCEAGQGHDGQGCQPEPEPEPEPEPDACHAPGAAPCPADELCEVVAGEARCACMTGFTRCGQACIDTRIDWRHCGSCDYACAADLGCHAGQCAQAVHELVLGEQSSCALMELGSSDGVYPLKCWGSDDAMLFRDPAMFESLLPRSIVDVPAVRSMAMTDGRSCVIEPAAEGGQVKCWGICGKDCGTDAPRSSEYQTLHEFEAPGAVRLSTAKGYKGLFDFGGATCALGATGELSCIGYAVFVTNGMDRLLPDPVRVATPSNTPKFLDVSGNYMHTCGVLDEGQGAGRVVCWGGASAEWLGADSGCVNYVPFSSSCTTEQAVAVYVRKEEGGDLGKAVAVRVYGALSCALTKEGEVYCWGGNSDFGVLGSGDTLLHTGAVKVAGLQGENIVEVAVGGSFACARAERGQVWCWGYGKSLGIGDGVSGDAQNGSYYSSPQPLPALTDALNVWAGNAHACARRRSGQVVCWGDNSGGQLGNQDKLSQTTPVPVENLW